MILPCEIAVKSVIPAVKALIAKELVEKQGLKQDEVARMLGISQSAVSRYTRKVRGHVIKIDDIDEVETLVNRMINILSAENFKRAEFLKAFCQTCKSIRRASAMCQFCHKTDPEIEVEECDFCLSSNSP